MCAKRMRNGDNFNPIENKAFYEFILYACVHEKNIRMRLMLLKVYNDTYRLKIGLSKPEEIWLLAYLEGALLNHGEFV